MGLILPGSPEWQKCTANFGTGTPTTTLGTTLTAGTANTLGSTTSVISALAHDCEYLVIGFSGLFASAGNSSALCDIMIDPAGGTSWSATPLISRLLAGYSSAISVSGNSAGGIAKWYHFPLWIKSGTSIGARIQCATASQTGQIIVMAYGGSKFPDMWWCGQAVTDIGTATATSLGTSITPGNTGTYSSWTNFGSTTPAAARAVQFGIQGGGTTTMTALQYFFEFGIAGNRLGPTYYHVGTANEATGTTGSLGPLFAEIASGTQFQARATCSGTAQAMDVAAYIVH